MRLLLWVCVFAVAFGPGVARGQNNYRRGFDGRVSYSPPDGKDGVEFSARIKIVHDVYFGEAIVRHTAAEYELGEFAVVKGQRVPLSGLTAQQRKALTPDTLDLCYDVEADGKIVSTICERNVPPSAISGSPSWSEMFPGLSAAEAKALMKSGYQIVNVRIGAGGGYDLSAAPSARTEVRADGGGSSPTSQGSSEWESVDLRRDGERVWIRHGDGRQESLAVCEGADAGTAAAPADGPANAACPLPGYEVADKQARCARMLLGCPLAMIKDTGERTGLSVTDVVIQHRVSSTAPWTSWTQGCSAVGLAQLTALTPCATYELRMRSICDDGSQSAWTQTFKLKMECPSISRLMFPSVGPTHADVQYLRPGGSCQQSGQESFEVSYAPAGGSFTNVAHAGGALTLSGLKPKTRYRVRMRILYPGGVASAWSAEYTFTTR